MTRARKAGLIGGLAALGAVGAGWTGLQALARLPVAAPGAPSVRVEVPPGTSADAIGRELVAHGLIRSGQAWNLMASGKALKPGVYDLSPSETPARMLQKLTSGEQATTKVTFPEGFTLKKIAARLKEKGVIADEQAFMTLAKTGGKSFSPTLPANLEGYLFPDTYRFAADATAKDIIQQMLRNFERRAAGKIQASGKPIGPTLIKASLIEREAEVEEDRAKIAGVIENRLKKGMRLQIDATVQYALPKHKPRLLFADLKYPSPYNTYLHKGLPPGPICNPGLASIEAVLKPESSAYLFYVAGKDGKKHLFAKTFEEHKKNIASVRG